MYSGSRLPTRVRGRDKCEVTTGHIKITNAAWNKRLRCDEQMLQHMISCPPNFREQMIPEKTEGRISPCILGAESVRHLQDRGNFSMTAILMPRRCCCAWNSCTLSRRNSRSGRWEGARQSGLRMRQNLPGSKKQCSPNCRQRNVPSTFHGVRERRAAAVHDLLHNAENGKVNQ